MSDPAGTAAFGRSREDAEFSQLYDRYYRPVRDFCRRRVASDLVDDAVAETFLNSPDHRHATDGQSSRPQPQQSC